MTDSENRNPVTGEPTVEAMLNELPALIGESRASDIRKLSEEKDQALKDLQAVADQNPDVLSQNFLSRIKGVLNDSTEQVVRWTYKTGKLEGVAREIRSEIIHPITDSISPITSLLASSRLISVISIIGTVVMGVLGILASSGGCQLPQIFRSPEITQPAPPPTPNSPSRAKEIAVDLAQIESLSRKVGPGSVLDKITEELFTILPGEHTEERAKLVSDLGARLSDYGSTSSESFDQTFDHFSTYMLDVILVNLYNLRNDAVDACWNTVKKYDLQKSRFGLPITLAVAESLYGRGLIEEADALYEGMRENGEQTWSGQVPLPEPGRGGRFKFTNRYPNSLLRERLAAIDRKARTEAEKRADQESLEVMKTFVVGIYDSRSSDDSSRSSSIANAISGYVKEVKLIPLVHSAEPQRFGASHIYRYRANDQYRRVSEKLEKVSGLQLNPHLANDAQNSFVKQLIRDHQGLDMLIILN